MPRSDAPTPSHLEPLVYSPVARALHWSIAALVLVTLPIGFIMVDREDAADKIADQAAKTAFEAVTNQMFSWHKAIGVAILLLMIGRWIYRLMHGAPRSEPTLAAWEKGLSHAVHWSLYLLLLAVAIGGYLGIAIGGYLDVFGVHLPSFGLAKDDKLAETIFDAHKLGGKIIAGLVALHLAGVVHHRFIKGDGVLARMWPGAKI
jgi:cytochrome b561